MRQPSVLLGSLASVALFALPASAKVDVENGRKLYVDTCQSCHGDKGQGNPVMYKRANAKIVHLGSEDAQQKSDDFIRKTMTDGWQKMEKVDDITSPQQVEDVLAFIRTLRLDKSKAAPAAAPAVPGTKSPEPKTDAKPAGKSNASAEKGGKLYVDLCQSCHGDKGQGNPVMYKRVKAKVVHLGSKEAQQKSDDFIRKSMTDGWQKMEKVEDLTTPQQVEDVLAFVRTLKLEEPKK